ncbi:MAG TPA: phosphoenolpyruvate hydrolase family protein [Actinomycetota bacterium]|jgi:predicted TIM-barrel enzyme|nr:phosphoenolpyruvate hydrolase family protein [Actinomycetota bacterium]
MTRRAIIAIGVGSGLTAAGAVAGGADLLGCYSTACYRIMGLPSSLAFLPYDDANALVSRALPEVLASAGNVPVVAGVGAHDPRLNVPRRITELAAAGVSGVTNEPFIGMYDGDLRRQLEAAGLGYARELDLARTATEAGMLVIGWAWNPEEAARMAATGASHVGCMLGITSGGHLGGGAANSAVSPHQAGELLADMVAAVRAENPDSLTLIHGGPLHSPSGVQEALNSSGADGYLAGSSAERNPVVAAVKETVEQFCTLTTNH